MADGEIAGCGPGGKNQYWTRLPEAAFNEIDPRFNPDPPPAPGRKPAGAMKRREPRPARRGSNGSCVAGR
jgi:hypothetical protein